jgi:hypothetical protein
MGRESVGCETVMALIFVINYGGSETTVGRDPHVGKNPPPKLQIFLAFFVARALGAWTIAA